VTLRNAQSGQEALYGLPVGRMINHVHVWKSLLERAGLSLDEIPKTWKGFWSFWCDQASPAVRKALGRDDIWAIGRPMSVEAYDTTAQFFQFIHAYDADYVTRAGRLVIDDPEIRQRLIKALDAYAAVYREGCTPPDSLSWENAGNNQAFLAQTVVMTPNQRLSIPNALKATRPKDYYENAASIDWPAGAYGQPLVIETGLSRLAVFRDGEHVATAKEFVRFLVGEGWLANYLNFSDERMQPPLPKLLDAPFWLDPGDPHRMRSAMQLLTKPRSYDYAAVSGEWRYSRSLPWSEEGGDPWPKPSTASQPTASAPSRRSTRRSRASSRLAARWSSDSSATSTTWSRSSSIQPRWPGPKAILPVAA
jgi:multiple sugar transport system substrate-binding protein